MINVNYVLNNTSVMREFLNVGISAKNSFISAESRCYDFTKSKVLYYNTFTFYKPMQNI